MTRVREDDYERAQDFDEKHIRRAVERQDAQTKSQTEPDITTDTIPQDIQPDNNTITQSRPRESDLPLQGGVGPEDERPTKRPMSSTQLSRRWERLSEGIYIYIYKSDT